MKLIEMNKEVHESMIKEAFVGKFLLGLAKKPISTTFNAMAVSDTKATADDMVSAFRSARRRGLAAAGLSEG